jgi:ABC-type sulfate transport system substrate-binding protein
MYVRGYLQGSENGRVVTIAIYSDLQELLKKENLVAITNWSVKTPDNGTMCGRTYIVEILLKLFAGN